MRTFTHIDATTIGDALSQLTAHKGTAAILAGGTDLLGGMKDEILPTYPEFIVNIKTIPNMSYIKSDTGFLKIGALTKLSQIASDSSVQAKYSALSQAAYAVGSPLLRNAGTIGGNLCQGVRCWYYRAPDNYFNCYRKGGTICFAVAGDNRYHAILGGKVCFAACPSDTAISLTALDAIVVTNTRQIPIANFYSVLGNSLSDNEIITEIQVPEPKAGIKQVFLKHRIRKTIDFAISSVATAITFDTANKVVDARIVLGGVSPIPYRATDAESVLKGNSVTESLATTAAVASVKGAIPLTNNGYLVPLTTALVKKAILT